MNLLSFLSFFKKEKLGVIVIIILAASFFLVRGCGTKSTNLTIDSFACDTIYSQVTVYDTIWKKAPIPDPVIKFETVFVEVPIHDTVFVSEANVEVPEPEVKFIARKDSLFVYDSTFVEPAYKLFWHVESLGRVRAFAHRLEFTVTEASITQTNNIIPIIDERKWMILAEGLLQTRFNSIVSDEYYMGGALIRNQKNILYGGGYYNQIGGDGHLFKATLGVKF